MSKIKLLAAVAGVALMGSAVKAAPVVTVTHTVPTAAMLAADPTLAGDIINDIKVTVPAGEDYTNTSMFSSLTTGSLYNAPQLGAPNAANSKVPQTLFWGVFANTEADSFVSSPNFAAPTILGGNTNGRPSGDTAAGTDQFTNQVMGVAYGDTNNDPPGTYTIARLTMTPTSTGTVSLTAFTTSGGTGTFFTAPITGGVIGGTVGVPEPTSAVLLAGGLGLIATRRRRQA
jgi:hypothetical protein